MKTPERRQGRCSSVFIVNFEHISHLSLAFILLTLKKHSICIAGSNVQLIPITLSGKLST